jgi:hypothetical protein
MDLFRDFQMLVAVKARNIEDQAKRVVVVNFAFF